MSDFSGARRVSEGRVKTPLQTLDGIYMSQPKRFLPLAKEAKKLAEEFQKEQITSQWP